ncbi:MAG: glucose-1-phosphate adenylyltransferase [Nitrospirota bacterium]|nr:glucose-1-phosphate adenylyltransferase [Nitrospirota bacterium]
MKNVLAIILAGGKGERLHPLTLHRAKPAVPFAGKYRIIDFTLSNCVNSNLRRIAVLTQYKSASLERHIRMGWDIFNRELNEFIFTIPPQQRVGDEWYQGTADAIYQNIYFVEAEKPDYLIVLSGDHVYKMDYSQMLAFHLETGADATVGALEVPLKEASSFGIIHVDKTARITGFLEKPKDPPPVPHNPNVAFASMGIYIFNTKDIVRRLKEDAKNSASSHDFGKDLIPSMVNDGGKVYAYNFQDENKKEAKYWRDVGTIDAYWEANIDLAGIEPLFNLYDPDWPVRTYQGQFPPAKFVFAQMQKGGRLGVALDSIVSGGCIISGGKVQNSVLSSNVRVNSYAEVTDSVVMEYVNIGRHCKIRRAIIDKGVDIPQGTMIGYDLEEDRKRYTVTESGIVVVAKGQEIGS